MSKVIIYTDGGCEPNPGNGGWAWAIDQETYGSGKMPNVTNNIMELTAIAKAIEFARGKFGKESTLVIHSDSQYCVKGFNVWMHNWANRNWRKSDGEPVKNQEIWQALFKERNNVEIVWVRGHNGNLMNEFVDSLCTAQIREDVGEGKALDYEVNKLEGEIQAMEKSLKHKKEKLESLKELQSNG